MSNPYVGPRSFTDGEALYGREDDVSQLFYLLLADRVVLLYSPSGAGKTSLLQARLTPRLREENFHVFMIHIDKLPSKKVDSSTNRYLLATMLSIEEELKKEDRLPLEELGVMPFADYLKRVQALPDLNGKPLALIFDQFEEIFTLDPIDDTLRREFFNVVGEVLKKNRVVWALFAMREEFIARLDEYESAMPARLQSRRRLSLLTRKQAIDAMQGPAVLQGVTFSAATKLAEDLSRIRIQRPDGVIDPVSGPYVEPVQLQVVCRTLWDKPRRKKTEISERDLHGAVNVDTALADYYKLCIDELVSTGVPERLVRDWFSRELITDRGVRKKVMLAEGSTAGLVNQAIDVLIDKHHLVRREESGNRIFFELAHDRLVEPIRASNVVWAGKHLNKFQSRAAEWEATRNPQLLLRDVELVEARRWAVENATEVTPTEQRFLEESRARLTEFERAAIDWEFAGRDPEMVLKGEALAFARRNAQQKGTFGITASERALLTSSNAYRRMEQRERIFKSLAGALPMLVVVGGILAAIEFDKRKQRELRTAVINAERASIAVVDSSARKLVNRAWVDNPRPLDSKAIAQLLDAQLHIAQLTETVTSASPQHKASIRYFVRPSDNPKLVEALRNELGFEVTEIPSHLAQRTNTISYGLEVPPEEVKLIAYAVIRAGNDLQTVQPLRRPNLPPNTVTLGFNAAVVDETPLATADIDSMDLAKLERPLATFIGAAEGKVKTYDPASREGMIDNKDGEIFFRLDQSDATVAEGSEVQFAIYENIRRRYATEVEKKREPAPEIPATTESSKS